MKLTPSLGVRASHSDQHIIRIIRRSAPHIKSALWQKKKLCNALIAACSPQALQIGASSLKHGISLEQHSLTFCHGGNSGSSSGSNMGLIMTFEYASLPQALVPGHCSCCIQAAARPICRSACLGSGRPSCVRLNFQRGSQACIAPGTQVHSPENFMMRRN